MKTQIESVVQWVGVSELGIVYPGKPAEYQTPQYLEAMRKVRKHSTLGTHNEAMKKTIGTIAGIRQGTAQKVDVILGKDEKEVDIVKKADIPAGNEMIAKAIANLKDAHGKEAALHGIKDDADLDEDATSKRALKKALKRILKKQILLLELDLANILPFLSYIVLQSDKIAKKDQDESALHPVEEDHLKEAITLIRAVSRHLLDFKEELERLENDSDWIQPKDGHFFATASEQRLRQQAENHEKISHLHELDLGEDTEEKTEVSPERAEKIRESKNKFKSINFEMADLAEYIVNLDVFQPAPGAGEAKAAVPVPAEAVAIAIREGDDEDAAQPDDVQLDGINIGRGEQNEAYQQLDEKGDVRELRSADDLNKLKINIARAARRTVYSLAINGNIESSSWFDHRFYFPAGQQIKNDFCPQFGIGEFTYLDSAKHRPQDPKFVGKFIKNEKQTKLAMDKLVEKHGEFPHAPPQDEVSRLQQFSKAAVTTVGLLTLAGAVVAGYLAGPQPVSGVAPLPPLADIPTTPVEPVDVELQPLDPAAVQDYLLLGGPVIADSVEGQFNNTAAIALALLQTVVGFNHALNLTANSTNQQIGIAYNNLDTRIDTVNARIEHYDTRLLLLIMLGIAAGSFLLVAGIWALTRRRSFEGRPSYGPGAVSTPDDVVVPYKSEKFRNDTPPLVLPEVADPSLLDEKVAPLDPALSPRNGGGASSSSLRQPIAWLRVLYDPKEYQAAVDKRQARLAGRDISAETDAAAMRHQEAVKERGQMLHHHHLRPVGAAAVKMDEKYRQGEDGANTTAAPGEAGEVLLALAHRNKGFVPPSETSDEKQSLRGGKGSSKRISSTSYGATEDSLSSSSSSSSSSANNASNYATRSAHDPRATTGFGGRRSGGSASSMSSSSSSTSATGGTPGSPSSSVTHYTEFVKK